MVKQVSEALQISNLLCTRQNFSPDYMTVPVYVRCKHHAEEKLGIKERQLLENNPPAAETVTVQTFKHARIPL